MSLRWMNNVKQFRRQIFEQLRGCFHWLYAWKQPQEVRQGGSGWNCGTKPLPLGTGLKIHPSFRWWCKNEEPATSPRTGDAGPSLASSSSMFPGMQWQYWDLETFNSHWNHIWWIFFPFFKAASKVLKPTAQLMFKVSWYTAVTLFSTQFLNQFSIMLQ